ncbi:IS1096 element passenger TnpR family protein [Bacillus sp. NEB1478]|uniref:IS1096 element passenger TnpR family protein n=1 Tax=Bacillus sp. NEB1478 TaxID=3073816 RepID=UPI0037BE4B5C
MIEDGPRYPHCLEGSRSRPPEDVGGPGGYSYFLSIIGNPKDEEYEHMMQWAEEDTDGRQFDPEHFDLKEMNRRLKKIKC